MGARKRKATALPKVQYLEFYKTLSIHERIAVKTAFWWIARRRLRLVDFIRLEQKNIPCPFCGTFETFLSIGYWYSNKIS